MTAYYDSKPSILEALGNGSYRYRYGIKEVERPRMDMGDETSDPGTQWQCEEVTVWAPLSANKITENVLTERWDANYEQKLVNEYNAAQLGLLPDEEAYDRMEAYKSFLRERAALKAQVDSDCEELGIK